LGRLREKMQTAAKSRGTVKGEIKGLKSRLRKGTGTAVPVLQMHKNRLFSAGEQPERRRSAGRDPGHDRHHGCGAAYSVLFWYGSDPVHRPAAGHLLRRYVRRLYLCHPDPCPRHPGCCRHPAGRLPHVQEGTGRQGSVRCNVRFLLRRRHRCSGHDLPLSAGG